MILRMRTSFFQVRMRKGITAHARVKKGAYHPRNAKIPSSRKIAFLIVHEGVPLVSGLSKWKPQECFPINNKPDYCLTDLYYDLHDKQLTNQNAIQKWGGAIIIEVALWWAWWQCLLIAMELQWESDAAMSPSLLTAVETHADKPVSCRFDISLV